MKKYAVILTVFLLLLACISKPKPIVYGSDGCHFCSMTIVDKQHAAQIMTKKGRTYSFDATECMLNHIKDIEKSTVATFLVNNYSAPGETVDALTATYLISKNIPSPMGEYLTAFGSLEAAKFAHEENGGTLFTWEEIQERFK